MKLLVYIIYSILLYLIYIVFSYDYSIIEHLKKDIHLNPLSGRNNLNIGDWKLLSAKGEKCDNSIYPLCDKLYIQDPNGSKILLNEIESDVLDKKY